MLSVNQKGVLGLVKVTAHLVEHRYEVFTPISDACPVDLIAANPHMVLRRIQVKYREQDIKGAFLYVSLDSVVNGKRVPVDLSLIDGWGIYCPTTESTYYVRRDEVVGRGIRLCLRDSKVRRSPLAEGFRDPARLW